MNKFKVRVARLSFMTSFFFHFGGCLLLGLVLLLVGIKVPLCHSLGIGFIAFDVIASVIETIKTLAVLKHTDNPLIKEIGDAVNSEDPYERIKKLLIARGLEIEDEEETESDDVYEEDNEE